MLFLDLLNWLVEMLHTSGYKALKHFGGPAAQYYVKPMIEASEKMLCLLSTIAICGCKPGFGKLEQNANVVECQSETKTQSCEIHWLADIFLVLLSHFNMTWLVWWLAFKLFCFPVSEALRHCQNCMKLSQATGYQNRG